MVLTRDFSETIRARVQRDPAFRVGLLKEAMDCLLEGDVTVGKGLLRDYINATVGFEELADHVKMPSKSLHRMFGPKGNPRADNLFRILSALQQLEDVEAKIQFVGPRAKAYGDVNAGRTLGVQEMRARYRVRRR